MYANKRFLLTISLLSSILAHLMALYFIDHLLNSNLKSLSIKNGSPAIQKIKLIGKKNGSKYFSRPQKKYPVSPPTNTNKKLSLSALGVMKQPQGQKHSYGPKKAPLSNPFTYKVPVNNSNSNNNSSIAFQFEVPEGVSLDKLNSMDKIFYSFYLRVFDAYHSSFVRTYNQMVPNNNLLQKSLSLKQQALRGKITFDSSGNILRIQFINRSVNDIVQKMFETTLEKMSPLYNPPAEFVKNDNEFSIYYILDINSERT